MTDRRLETQFDHDHECDNFTSTEKSPDDEECSNKESLSLAVSGVPDGGWGWMCAFGGFIISVIAGVATQCFSILFLELQQRFGSSTAATAWVYSCNMTVCMLVGPLCAVLCRRYTCRLVTVVAGVVCSACYVATAFTPTLWGVYLIYGVIGGIGAGMINLPTLFILNEYFDKNRGKATAFVLLGRGLGSLAFAPILTYTFQEYGFTGAMVILGGISLHACVGGALFRPVTNRKLEDKTLKISNLGHDGRSHDGCGKETEAEIGVHTENCPRDEHEAQQGDQAGEYDHSGNRNGNKASIALSVDMKTRMGPSLWSKLDSTFHFSLFGDSNFRAYGLLSFALALNMSTINVCIASIARERGFSSAQRALLVSLMGGVSLVSRPITGVVYDIKAVRRHRCHLLSVTGMAVSLCCLFAPFSSSVPGVFVNWVVFGFLSSSFTTQETVALSDLVGSHRLPAALGLGAWIRAIGIFTGPTFGGYLRDVSSNYDLTLYFIGGSFLIASIVFEISLLCRSRRQASGKKRTMVTAQDIRGLKPEKS